MLKANFILFHIIFILCYIFDFRSCEKQPLVGGIPVPVVKTSYFHNFPSTHNSYGEYKDWSSSTNDMYAYQRQQRGLITDSLMHAPKIAIP